jgi:glutaminase
MMISHRTTVLWTVALATLATLPSAALARPTGPTGSAPEAIIAAIKKAYDDNKFVTEGKNADYIPALAGVNPNLFGIALITTEGRTFEIGDTKARFSIQSISKAFTLARVMADAGPEVIEKQIGVDATGGPFNSITAIELNTTHRAGNPLVNPGAIATVSYVEGENPEERWKRIIGNMSDFAGRPLEVDEQVYRSEGDTNTRNRAISYLLKAYDVIRGNPDEALDLYTRQCSVSVDARDLAAMGATLANGGTNPITRKEVVTPLVAERVLAMMLTYGLYEHSGRWSYEVGAPAKSGVGGGIVAVIPGKYAIAVFSPPLDKAGNSVRGQRAIAQVVKSLGSDIFLAPPAPGLASSP